MSKTQISEKLRELAKVRKENLELGIFIGSIWGNDAESALIIAADHIDQLNENLNKVKYQLDASELMAECTTMLKDDLVSIGIISKSVPPMMLTEAIMSYIQNITQERDEWKLRYLAL